MQTLAVVDGFDKGGDGASSPDQSQRDFGSRRDWLI
jgi:hypothetical protein